MGVRPHAELLELYGEYDVFAFPTRDREPFGLVPLEAAARGCVPVITRRCGIAEWLVHGVHCLKVDRSCRGLRGRLGAILEGEIALEPMAAPRRRPRPGATSTSTRSCPGSSVSSRPPRGSRVPAPARRPRRTAWRGWPSS